MDGDLWSVIWLVLAVETEGIVDKREVCEESSLLIVNVDADGFVWNFVDSENIENLVSSESTKERVSPAKSSHSMKNINNIDKLK